MAKILEFSRLAFEAAESEKKNPPPQDWKGWMYYQLTNVFVTGFSSYAGSAQNEFLSLPEEVREQLYQRMYQICLSPRRKEQHAFDDLLKVASAVEDLASAVFNSLGRNQKKITCEKANIAYANTKRSCSQSPKRRRIASKCDPMHLLEAMAQLPTYRDRIIGKVDAWCKKLDSDFQASKKVKKAIVAFLDDEKQNRLDLSNCGLSSLPPVFDYPPFPEKLRQLNLEKNLFNAMPGTLRHLKNLEWLGFNTNALISLPDWIHVFSSLERLDFSNNALEGLPPSFKQLSSLIVVNLNNNRFSSFPGELSELSNLCSVSLANHPDLTSVPPEVLDLSNSCEIDFSGCGLSQRIVDEMRDVMDRPDYPGPNLFFTLEERVPYKDFPVEQSLDLLYKTINRKPRRFPDLTQDPISEGYLRRWLSRLIDMADYKTSGAHRRSLAGHIISYLELAQSNPEFRMVFFSLIKRAGETCGDRMALSVLHIGLSYKIVTFDKSRTKAFSELLIRGVFVVDLLERLARERIALEKTSRLRYVDEIEVYLGYPVMLKARLSIPIDVDAMLFFRSSILKECDLDFAERYVQEKLADRQACFRFLMEQPEWRGALKAKYPEGYAAVEKKIDELLDEAIDHPSKMPKVEEEREKLFSALTLAAIQ